MGSLGVFDEGYFIYIKERGRKGGRKGILKEVMFVLSFFFNIYFYCGEIVLSFEG